MNHIPGMAVIVAMLALTPVLSAAPPMRIALLVDNSAATAGAIVQIRTAVSALSPRFRLPRSAGLQACPTRRT